MELHFAWSPPSGQVQATYRAEMLAYQAVGDRYVCRLVELLVVERTGSSAEVSDETLRGLIGKCVRAPAEALDGIVLPLKLATLTGGLARPYFFNAE
ncbi:MAG TPA: hypothetical protein VJG32_20025 [Anaerolineae bacterium]|nr:hypothetical protein [Anaerolineae bacterium]